MPIEYAVDHERRLVFAWGRGTFTDEDVFGYQREVWSRPDVAGYNELVDMSDVEKIETPSAERVRDLAQLSVQMDGDAPQSKFAIFAPTDLAFGLGRMYQAYREVQLRGAKRVGVFRSLEEALAFLCVEGDPPQRPGTAAEASPDATA